MIKITYYHGTAFVVTTYDGGDRKSHAKSLRKELRKFWKRSIEVVGPENTFFVLKKTLTAVEIKEVEDENQSNRAS